MKPWGRRAALLLTPAAVTAVGQHTRGPHAQAQGLPRSHRCPGVKGTWALAGEASRAVRSCLCRVRQDSRQRSCGEWGCYK